MCSDACRRCSAGTWGSSWQILCWHRIACTLLPVVYCNHHEIATGIAVSSSFFKADSLLILTETSLRCKYVYSRLSIKTTLSADSERFCVTWNDIIGKLTHFLNILFNSSPNQVNLLHSLVMDSKNTTTFALSTMSTH